MSKTSKARSSERRKAAKQSRRASNKALYRARAIAGENTKSKRNQRKQSGRNHAYKGMHHNVHDCGNIGCKKCNPVLATA